jgi:hypothetical protein
MTASSLSSHDKELDTTTTITIAYRTKEEEPLPIG